VADMTRSIGSHPL